MTSDLLFKKKVSSMEGPGNASTPRKSLLVKTSVSTSSPSRNQSKFLLIFRPHLNVNNADFISNTKPTLCRKHQPGHSVVVQVAEENGVCGAI